MTWFWTLNESLQLALINVLGLIGSGIISATIAYLGFRITLQTSTAANERIASITRENNSAQIQFSAVTKLADMKREWLESLRNDLARFATEVANYITKRTESKTYEDETQYLLMNIHLKLRTSDEQHADLFSKMDKLVNLRNRANNDPHAFRKRPDYEKECHGLMNEFFDVAHDIIEAEHMKIEAEIQRDLYLQERT